MFIRHARHRLGALLFAAAFGGFLPSANAGNSADGIVATGLAHACSIYQGGVSCWGDNRSSQLGVSASESYRSSPAMVPTLGEGAGATFVSAGALHACAVVGGGVQCWGNNNYGQVDPGDAALVVTAPRFVPGLPAGAGAIAVSLGDFHSCALLADQTVRCWGSDLYGERSDGTQTPAGVKPNLVSVSAIAAGGSHTCAISGGFAYCWGRNDFGQLGDGTVVDSATPKQVAALLAFTAIAAGGDHTCGRAADATVRCWGRNQFSQLGNGTTANAMTPQLVQNLGGAATAVAAGIDHSCAVVNGGLRCWGDNDVGQIGDGTLVAKAAPTTVPGTLGAVGVAAGDRLACAHAGEGSVVCWGLNERGQVGDGSVTTQAVPTPGRQVVSPNAPFTTVAAGGAHSCAASTDNEVRCWGRSRTGESFGGFDEDANFFGAPTYSAGTLAELSAGYRHACIVAGDNVRCWGDDSSGQLGNGAAGASSTPTPVAATWPANTASHVSAGRSHTCALANGGAARCWGNNIAGQLGNGTIVSSQTPVNVSGIAVGATDIAAGGQHSCAVVTSGLPSPEVRCWGQNSAGQLGRGNAGGTYPSPQQVLVNVVSLPPLTGATTIATGDAHSCAISTGGALRCWGRNANGQLGDGTTTSSPLAKLVPGMNTGVAAVAAGKDHTCAIKSGSLYCWGSNGKGQVGGTGTGNTLTPQLVYFPVNAVSAGDEHTCYVITTGTAYCFGNGLYGRLGDGNFGYVKSPYIVGNFTGVLFSDSFE